MFAGIELRRRLAPPRRRYLAALAAGLTSLAVCPAGAHAAFGLGLQDPAFDGTATLQQAAAGYKVMSDVGASVVRLNAFWYQIAPVTPGPGFQATNPADPQYRWTALDTAIREAAKHHVTVLLTLSGAPSWAQGPDQPPGSPIGTGGWDPNPVEYGQFVQAAAQRYSGRFADPVNQGQILPRVKYFEMWNEENLPEFLAAPKVVKTYEALLTDGYNAVKSVRHDDKVVFGGLAPVSYLPGLTVSPLKFAAQVMCLRRVRTRFVRTGRCHGPPFDIFAAHPYSLAVTPTQSASSYDDVLVADVPKLRDLLRAAEKQRTISGNPPLWVTEWGWVTFPPDRQVGDSFKIAARYVAYSMYEMWKAGVSLVVWQGIHDDTPTLLLGTGLETKSGRRKPSMQAFGFPFIASVGHGRGFAWGRVPDATRSKVDVQRLTAHGWRRVAKSTTGRDGVFTVSFPATGNGTYRASADHGIKSLPYFSARIPARHTHPR